MKYLLNIYGPDENCFFGFESDLSKSELLSILKSLENSTEEYSSFIFLGIIIDKLPFSNYRLITLDEFWDLHKLTHIDKPFTN